LRIFEIFGGRNEQSSSFSPSIFDFPRLSIIPPLLHPYLSRDSCGQIAQHENLSLEVCGFNSELALDWSQIKDVKNFLKISLGSKLHSLIHLFIRGFKIILIVPVISHF
jgi:hypothetical protein